jgi:cation diffusion facilitator CzcD-associated flavoprotein CzcO
MIVVIGAGPCGITVAKNLLQQGLTHFIVFEKNSQLGGNWLFGEDNLHSSVYETTHIISSKRLSAFEDFPMPESYPDYPSHAQLLTYFNAYADHFGVRPFIQFNSDVLQVTRDDSNQWHVVYRNADGEHTMTAAYLVVANGHHWDPRWPSYPGFFHGQQMHSHDYK